jgi:protoporphyrin/coproporphyrin ferrochelatase
MSAARKVAVVVFNLGGPDSPDAVRPFLFNLFNDPAIITYPALFRTPLAALISTTRTKTAQANYAHMGGSSPLLPETQAQAAALTTALAGRLDGAEARVFIAMRYWRPTTADAARDVAAWAPDEVVLLPLYPQYSTTTTGSSLKAWKAAYRGPGRVHAVCCYPTLEGLAAAHAARIETAWRDGGSPQPIRLLFSAHGLPEKIVAGGDPYQAQIEATAAAVMAKLGAGWDWQVCYQSRVGPMKWLGPSTPEALAKAAIDGKGVLVCPIAFVSEHVETLVELDIDFAKLAAEMGIETYIRVPALGMEPAFIDGLAESVARVIGRDGAISPASGWTCPAVWARCPLKGDRAA